MTKAVIGLAVSVLLAGFMIAAAIERNTPRYSTFDGHSAGPLRFDRVAGTFTLCHWKDDGRITTIGLTC
jgi:hypothetical protein